MKIVFRYKGKEYFIVCRSFEYSNKVSWFYTANDVKGIRGKVNVISSYYIKDVNSYNELNGYTNFESWM